jgi:riboflavin synthase
MFTGIVEDTGLIVTVTGDASGKHVEVESALDFSKDKLGDSVSVSGVCLTIVDKGERGGRARISFDLGPETLAVSTLGALAPGARVHLERAMRMDDRLGGHLVSGHVDALGVLLKRTTEGGSLFLRFEAPASVLRLCVHKGSITIEGVSLTLNAVDAAGFEVCLIPHTLEKTRLGELVVGERVNLESDLIGKYVERLVAPHLATPPSPR